MRWTIVVGLLMAVLFAAPASAVPARIVFASDDQLWAMNADGSAASQLTHLGPRREPIEPDWSPDGARLAVTMARPNGRSRIWTLGTDGGDPRPLTAPVPKNAYELSPAWSHDGGRIAFVRVSFGEESVLASLLVIDADGSHERTVVRERVRNLGGFSSPAWSPDGQRLLFTRTFL